MLLLFALLRLLVSSVLACFCLRLFQWRLSSSLLVLPFRLLQSFSCLLLLLRLLLPPAEYTLWYAFSFLCRADHDNGKSGTINSAVRAQSSGSATVLRPYIYYY